MSARAQHVVPARVCDCDLAAFWRWAMDPKGGAFIEVKDLGDGRYAGIRRLIFHYTMIVGEIGNEYTYLDRYCYETIVVATAALRAWDGTGDPLGWHRHPKTNRRRPGGNPAHEHIEA